MPDEQECVQRAMALLEAADEIEQLRHLLPNVYPEMVTPARQKVLDAQRLVDGAQQDAILDMAAGALVYAEDYDSRTKELRPAKDKLHQALIAAHDEISLFALQQLLSCVGGKVE